MRLSLNLIFLAGALMAIIVNAGSATKQALKLVDKIQLHINERKKLVTKHSAIVKAADETIHTLTNPPHQSGNKQLIDKAYDKQSDDVDEYKDQLSLAQSLACLDIIPQVRIVYQAAIDDDNPPMDKRYKIPAWNPNGTIDRPNNSREIAGMLETVLKSNTLKDSTVLVAIRATKLFVYENYNYAEKAIQEIKDKAIEDKAIEDKAIEDKAIEETSQGSGSAIRPLQIE